MRQLGDAKRLVSVLLTDIDTPRSLTVYLLAKAGEWGQLAALAVDPSHYLDAISSQRKFARDFQATELLRKCSDLKVDGVDRELAARDSFRASEKANYRTNARLEPWLEGYPESLDPLQASRMWNIIRRIRKDIRRVLGPVPRDLTLRFGPGTVVGATTAGRSPTLPDKLSMDVKVSQECLPIFRHLWPEAWERAFYETGGRISLNECERFTTVNKNALTDRTIGIQNLANLGVQLAIGSHWKTRLKEFACIDLVHGQATHAARACAASISNDDATIDHKNASNSTARLVFKLLGPADWYELLNDTRMRFSDFDSREGSDNRWRLEMFSAMGNGFTFELETLLFWAFARAVGVEHPLVYGDDVIVPSEYAADYIAVARYFGYETNQRKTYTTGPFRESCGGNFFLGLGIQPLRIEKLPKEPNDWISLHNGLYRASQSIGSSATRRAQLACISALPAPVRRCRGPEFLGDVVLHGLPVIRQRGSTVPSKGTAHVRVCVESGRSLIDLKPRWWTKAVAGIHISAHPDVSHVWHASHRYVRAYLPIAVTIPFERWGGVALQSAMALSGCDSSGVGIRDGIAGYRLAWIPA